MELLLLYGITIPYFFQDYLHRTKQTKYRQQLIKMAWKLQLDTFTQGTLATVNQRPLVFQNALHWPNSQWMSIGCTVRYDQMFLMLMERFAITG